MNITRHLSGHKWEILPRSEITATVSAVRKQWGYDPIMAPLLTLPDGSTKFAKGNVPICGVSMLPHTMVGPITMCAWSTPECRANCLVFSGRGFYPSVQRGRGWKTTLLIEHPDVWFSMLVREVNTASKKWPDLRVRLNVFSDVQWELLLPESFWTDFKKVRFMDYTKGWQRRHHDLPRNYRLVYSASERTRVGRIRELLAEGERVTVVFDLRKRDPLPKRWEGMRVVDGDVDDDLWSRPRGAVIGLRAKGVLRQADSGFKRKVA